MPLALRPEVAAAHARVLGANVALLGSLDVVIEKAACELEEVLPHTPAGILTTIPRVAVIRASNYGGALAIRRGSEPPARSTGWPSSFHASTSPRAGVGSEPRSPGGQGRAPRGHHRARSGSSTWAFGLRPLRRGTRGPGQASGRGGVRSRTPGQSGGLCHGERSGPVRPQPLEVAIERGRARHGRANSTRSTSPARDKLAICRPPVEPGEGAGTGATSKPVGSRKDSATSMTPGPSSFGARTRLPGPPSGESAL